MQEVKSSGLLLDLPLARLQIVQASESIEANWLERSMLEPVLEKNADGLWVLSVHRQGAYRQFEIPYIGSEIIVADAEFGLVVVLVSYHGSTYEKYGRLGYMTQKGQFYHYYWQAASGSWERVFWRSLNDEMRAFVIETVDGQGPTWARKPGKLKSERKPPAKQVEMIAYKVVRLIDGRYYSLHDPDIEYVVGERVKQRARPNHGGGFFTHPTLEMGNAYLEGSVEYLGFSEDPPTPHLALLECEIGGRIISYGHKMASTYLCPVRVLEVRERVLKREQD